jgi:hypothetical protein
MSRDFEVCKEGMCKRGREKRRIAFVDEKANDRSLM